MTNRNIMDREIKLRAKEVKTNEWVYFTLEQLVNTGYNFNELKDWGEFTGLFDKNGVEIYEGDIIENDNGIYLEIYWDKNSSGFKQRTCSKINVKKQGYEWSENSEDRTDVSLEFNFKKVIGNIYENKSLLK